jgi:hypothetical protein
MNKLFKTTLLATMIAGSFSAGAATLSTDALQLSTEGLALGNTAGAQTIAFDVVVDENNAASSTITLTFSDTVDLTGLDVTTPTDTDWTDGVATIGDVTFNVGTGNFTFSNLAVDTTANTLSYDVDLGNAITADSAYSVSIDVADITGAATVSYVAETAAGVQIETGSATVASEATQFAVSIIDEFDALIDRTTSTLFTDGASTDTLDLTVTNDSTLLAAAVVEGAAATVDGDEFDLQFTLEGDFTGLLDADFATGDLAGTVAADKQSVTFTLAGDDYSAATTTASDLIFDLVTAVNIPETGSMTLSAVIVDAADATNTYTVLSDADAGEWALDASVVNVPYLPVGYSNLSANVEYSNEGSTAAEVQIRGFDADGNVYSAVSLADAAANTITKYTEDDIMDAFGITEATKLNITFISDADADDVSIVPYYKEGESRVQTINDQYKGQ